MNGAGLPRLFISHSGKDNIHALAFQRWLKLKGWSRDDVFIDLHDMQAGREVARDAGQGPRPSRSPRRNVAARCAARSTTART
jgi:hypothetical protein